jgi:hypothetical protein
MRLLTLGFALLSPAQEPAPAAQSTPAEAAKGIADALREQRSESFGQWVDRSLESFELELLKIAYEVLAQRETEISGIAAPMSGVGRAVVELTVVSRAGERRVDEALFLCLGEAEAGWRLQAFELSAKAAREWLWLYGKPGSIPTASGAMRGFVEAFAAREAKRGEQLCTNDVWAGQGEILAPLFDISEEAAIELVVAEVVEQDGRAVGTLSLRAEAGEETLDLFLLRRRGGWLIAGMNEKPERSARFLAGEVGANPWPGSVPSALSFLVRALDDRRLVRLQRMHTAASWETGEFRQLFADLQRAKARVDAGDTLPVKDGRGVGWFHVRPPDGDEPATVWVHFRHTLDGWRIVGGGDEEETARAWLANG